MLNFSFTEISSSNSLFNVGCLDASGSLIKCFMLVALVPASFLGDAAQATI